MNDNPEKSSAGSENKPPNWVTVGISIVTIATVVAVATTAATVGIVWGRTGEGSLLITRLAVGPAVVSLIIYYVVVVTGLSTLFGGTQPGQEKAAKFSAIALSVQIYLVIVFALVATVGPLASAR